MMAPSRSLLDAADVRRWVGLVRAPPGVGPPPSPDAEAATTSLREPVAPPPPTATVVHASTLAESSAAQLRMDAGLLQGGDVEERLASLVAWLMGTTGAFAAFVADRDGLPLANRLAPDDYVVATAALVEAQDRLHALVPFPVDGSTTLELHDSNVLQVIHTRTAADGRLAVGLILAQPLGRPLMDKIRGALHAALQPDNAGART